MNTFRDENPGSGFDDDADAHAFPQERGNRAGRTGQGTAAPFVEDHGEESRFVEDFDTDAMSDSFEDVWISGGTLPEVPARQGYVQRYINTEDRSNYSNQTRRGWRPRAVETLPEGYKSTPKIQSGEYEGCIGVNGQILMEMPIALFAKHQQHQRNETEKLEKAVENNLYKTRGPGMAPTEKEATTRASVGRRVPIIPDDE